MNTLRFEKITITSANLGKTNCLPDIHNNSYIRAPITLTNNITASEREFIGKGMISTLLPYQIQDQYDRNREKKEFNAAILENDYLIATFIPELGGRLWSLYDKKEERELLYRNNIFQPCNLALRNAWFSGGVEWNVSIKGHNPLTCSPMFAKKVFNDSGESILKMYEFERIRGICYSICAMLKNDVLLVNIEIENTSNNDTYMYWWTNIAVDETEDTRIIVPTDKTFICAYSDGEYVLDSGTIPLHDGTDITYPITAKRSRDFFYKIPDETSKWIAAVKGDGKGLVHFSDNTLIGRKMFLWGQQNGGKHWNQWLSDRGDSYIEIQAGILKTQLEHFIMKKNSTISWTEGFSITSGDPSILHGNNYTDAIKAITTNLKDKLPCVYEDNFNIKNEEPLVLYGSGWGALENKIRSNNISSNCAFPNESLNYEQHDWLYLLSNGTLPEHDINDTIDSYVVGDFWIKKLENSTAKTWYTYNHLGIMYYAKGDYNKAAELFKKSIELTPNAWALRNLAQIKKNIQHETDIAANLMLRAIKLKSNYQPLLVDCASALINAERYNDWITIYDSISDELKNNGRLIMLLALCYVKTNQLEKAMKILTPSLCVVDVKEGEYALSTIWIDLYSRVISNNEHRELSKITTKEVLEKYPLPFELDYRMH